MRFCGAYELPRSGGFATKNRPRCEKPSARPQLIAPSLALKPYEEVRELTADAKTPTNEAATTQSFEADVSRLLHLMVHSVYSDREIFVRDSSLNQVDLAGCDHLLIPLDAYARRLWDVNLPVADFVVPLQNRVAPIQPFQ